MTNLLCSVINCANNSDNLCCLPDIKIDGVTACSSSETFCKSFLEKRDAIKNDVSFNEPNPITNVRCSAANCIYNDGVKKCAANTISIDGAGASNSVQTLCSSFVGR